MTWRAGLEDVPKHIDLALKKQLLHRVSMFRYVEYGVLGTSARTIAYRLPPVALSLDDNCYYHRGVFACFGRETGLGWGISAVFIGRQQLDTHARMPVRSQTSTSAPLRDSASLSLAAIMVVA